MKKDKKEVPVKDKKDHIVTKKKKKPKSWEDSSNFYQEGTVVIDRPGQEPEVISPTQE